MSSTSLTPNAVREVVAAGKQEVNFNPVCQIINIKNVTNKAANSGQPNRFRVIISDGECYIQGMLATQLNHMIEGEELKTHNIVRINQFMINGVKGKTLIVVLGLDILDTSIDHKIGNPVDVEKVGAVNLANSNQNSSAGPLNLSS